MKLTRAQLKKLIMEVVVASDAAEDELTDIKESLKKDVFEWGASEQEVPAGEDLDERKKKKRKSKKRKKKKRKLYPYFIGYGTRDHDNYYEPGLEGGFEGGFDGGGE